MRAGGFLGEAKLVRTVVGVLSMKCGTRKSLRFTSVEGRIMCA